MADYKPKFSPQDTPLDNYKGGVIQWSYFKLTFDRPLGPRVGKYDPYYIYSVSVQLGDEWIEHTWFATIEDHVRLQVAGAAKDAVMKATYVRDGKRRALVTEHVSGPIAPRQETTVRQEVKTAVNQLQSTEDSFDDSLLVNAPAKQQTPDPFTIQPVSTPTPKPVQQPTQQPAQQPAPPSHTSPATYPLVRNYQPLNNGEKEAWKARFSDLAELHLWAYGELGNIAKRHEVKIKPSDHRELMTSIAIQTWREFSAKGGLYGWTFVKAMTADTKDNALEKIMSYEDEKFIDLKHFVREYLTDVAEPVDNIASWKHAANIAALLGAESTVLYDDFDVDAMALLARAIWAYQGCRDEGMTRNESLQFVAEEYMLPIEAMDFEDEEEEQDENG